MREVEQEMCLYGRGDAERSPGVIPSPASQSSPPSPTARDSQESGTTPDTITVEEFEFVVNHPVFTQAELNSFTKGYLNKALSKTQLLSVAAEITKQYAARGYSTSSAVVYIPKTQQLGKRTAIIRVIEGELERIDVKSLPNKEHTEGSRVRLYPNYVRSAVGWWRSQSRFALATSKPLNVNKLQEAWQRSDFSDFTIRLFRLTGAGEESHDRGMERMQPLAKEQLNLIPKIEDKNSTKKPKKEEKFHV